MLELCFLFVFWYFLRNLVRRIPWYLIVSMFPLARHINDPNHTFVVSSVVAIFSVITVVAFLDLMANMVLFLYDPYEFEWFLRQDLRSNIEYIPGYRPAAVDHLLKNQGRYDFKGQYTINVDRRVNIIDIVHPLVSMGIVVHIRGGRGTVPPMPLLETLSGEKSLRYFDFSKGLRANSVVHYPQLIEFGQRGELHVNVGRRVRANLHWSPRTNKYYPKRRQKRALCIALCCKRVGAPLYAGGRLTEWGTRLIGHAIW